ncbi:hypothetical protein WG66_006452, partial [Moniliophthora roreri]
VQASRLLRLFRFYFFDFGISTKFVSKRQHVGFAGGKYGLRIPELASAVDDTSLLMLLRHALKDLSRLRSTQELLSRMISLEPDRRPTALECFEEFNRAMHDLSFVRALLPDTIDPLFVIAGLVMIEGPREDLLDHLYRLRMALRNRVTR